MPDSSKINEFSPALEAAIYRAIGKEIESNSKEIGAWTKAFAIANGDENKAKAAYIRLRFATLSTAQLRRMEAARTVERAAEEVAKRRANQERLQKQQEILQRMEVIDAIRNGQIPDAVKSLTGTHSARTYLRYCAEGRIKDIEPMILRNPALIGVANSDGDTGLHLAVRENYPVLVKVLAEGGSNVHAKNAFGQSPLEMARAWNFGPITEVLEQAAGLVFGFCPNCDTSIPLNSEHCPKCSAIYVGPDSWKVQPYP